MYNWVKFIDLTIFITNFCSKFLNFYIIANVITWLDLLICRLRSAIIVASLADITFFD
jgi:hypothetical protein